MDIANIGITALVPIFQDAQREGRLRGVGKVVQIAAACEIWSYPRVRRVSVVMIPTFDVQRH